MEIREPAQCGTDGPAPSRALAGGMADAQTESLNFAVNGFGARTVVGRVPLSNCALPASSFPIVAPPSLSRAVTPADDACVSSRVASSFLFALTSFSTRHACKPSELNVLSTSSVSTG
jgi:hypothetical protein